MSDRYRSGWILTLHETPDEVVVADGDDAADWIVRFRKSPSFAALGWARNMVDTFNRQALDDAERDATTRGGG